MVVEDRWRRGQITVALLVVLYGVIFLLHRTRVVGDYWWALLIVASALPSLLGVWWSYRAQGRLVGGVIVGLSTGLTILLVGLVLFSGWTMGAAWPLFLVLAGVIGLLHALRAK
jgi:peptidoglycan/LPS O-acetylase OafA/YrhL